MIGTEWKLFNLKQKPEWNGLIVTVADKMDDTYFKVRFIDENRDEAQKFYKINRKYLISKINPDVTPDLFEAAMNHLTESPDEHLKEIVTQIETGRFQEAISNAGKWSLNKLKSK